MITQEGKVALRVPQTDVKDVNPLAHFEAKNIYCRQENKIRHRFKKG